MTKVTSDLLASCLDDIRAGRSTLETCVADHPEVAEGLRELVFVARSIAPPPPIQPDASFRALGRARLITAMNATKPPVTESSSWSLRLLAIGRWAGSSNFRSRRLGMPALIIALVIALTTAVGGGTVYAAQGTIPGDTLYPVKIAAEQLQVIIATSDSAKAQTYLALADKRLSEIQQAIQSGRPASAAAASQAFTQDVTQADDHLKQAGASGQDVSTVASGFAANLTQLEAALTLAQAKAPSPAQPALLRAMQAATTGLGIASSYVPGTQDPSLADAGAEPTSEATRAARRVTITPDADASAPTSNASTSLATPVSTAVEQLISATDSLQTDSLVSGDSYTGLVAQLSAARAALDRGETSTATEILNAYLDKLNAMQRSGHISADNYAMLYAGYAELVGDLGGTPKPTVAARVTPLVGQVDDSPEARPTGTHVRGLANRPSPEATSNPETEPQVQPTAIPALPTQAAQPTQKPAEAVVPPAVPTPQTAPTEVPPTAVPTRPSVPPTTVPTPHSAPTQTPPTAVPTSAARPTPRSEPTSVPPTSVSPGAAGGRR